MPGLWQPPTTRYKPKLVTTHVIVDGHKLPVYIETSLVLYVEWRAGLALPHGACRAGFKTPAGAALVSLPVARTRRVREKIDAAPKG